jgi:hypothetical protein
MQGAVTRGREFVLCRQLDELSRRYRRLAAQAARLEAAPRRKPTLAITLTPYFFFAAEA